MRRQVLLLALVLAGCDPDLDHLGAARTGGDPARGRVRIKELGCGACHSIPGVRGASGRVGPPLDNIASRNTLAGHLPNTPDNLILWIRDPQGVEPGNVMPNLPMSDADARDIAAHLSTLR